MKVELTIVIVLSVVIVSASLALVVGITQATKNDNISSPTPPPTAPVPTVPPTDAFCGLIEGCQFGSSDLVLWDLTEGAGGSFPEIAEYGLGNFPTAPPGSNGFYLRLSASNPFEYALKFSGVNQNVDVVPYIGDEFLLESMVVLRDGAVVTANFDRIITLEIFDGDGNSLNNVICNSIALYNPTLSLPVTFGSGFYRWNVFGQVASNIFIENSAYPVYRRVDNENVFFLYDATNDQWKGYLGITYDITDLVDGFNMGTDGVDYTEEIIFPTGQFFNQDFGGIFCPVGGIGTTYIGTLPAIYVQDLEYTTNGDPNTIVTQFNEYKLSGITVPANAVSANVTILNLDTSSGAFAFDNARLNIV